MSEFIHNFALWFFISLAVISLIGFTFENINSYSTEYVDCKNCNRAVLSQFSSPTLFLVPIISLIILILFLLGVIGIILGTIEEKNLKKSIPRKLTKEEHDLLYNNGQPLKYNFEEEKE